MLDALWLGLKGTMIVVGFYLGLMVIAAPILGVLWLWDRRKK